jgi:hypothetical protein
MASARMAPCQSFSSLSQKIRRKLSSVRKPKQQTHTIILDQAITMEPTDTATTKEPTDTATTKELTDTATMKEPTDTVTMTYHPSELLHQVAKAMNWRHTEISVTVPKMTTWKTVLRAVDSALGEVDGPVMIKQIRSQAQQEKLRQVALENVRIMNSSSSANASPGLPIRTKYDIASLPSPKRASEETRKRLKEDAMPFMPFRQPYPFILHATIAEKTLPVVKAKVTLSGIDSSYRDPEESLESIEMIWDTGAHQTTITEDLLSDRFRQFLQDPQHDHYRSQDGLHVQMDAVINLSNTSIDISAIVLIVPKSVVPNERIGILFGQQQCIDRLSHRSIPRCILNAKGEDIGEGLGGTLCWMSEYVVDDGNIHPF